VARIKNRPAAEKDRPLPDWRIGCCYVGKGHRRQGVASAAIAGALDLIRERGGGTVEGYPEPAVDVSAGFLYHGALTTYEKLGFTRVRPIGKHRWVVGKRVRARRG
jgi:GNAT superfamily N-acetyltransferase